MPLVTTTEMFEKSMKGHYAIGAFNINNMEFIQAITEAANEAKSPVILQVSSSAIKYAGIKYLLKMAEAAVEETDIPIALHLDHGPDFETCKMCIDAGLPEYVNKFELHMVTPTTQEEIDRRSNLQNKVSIARDVMQLLETIPDETIKLQITKKLISGIINDGEAL